MIILALGTNLGDRVENLQKAITAIGSLGKIEKLSHIYESEPWGFDSDNGFMNMVLSLESNLSSEDLLRATQNIERELGRTKKSDNSGYSDRLIDIDIIDYNGEIIDSQDLQLPHRLMHERNFVLFPLCDIAPEWIHPLLLVTATELKAASKDTTTPLIFS